jgi:RHS repeat-associated protein
MQTEYTYGAFGQSARNGSENQNSAQYTGRENDGTELQHNRARYYSARLQRFISEDPIGFSGGDINLYAYVSNDPVNYTDPSGHSLVGRLVRRVGGKLLAGRKISMREAQAARRLEGDVIMENQRLARQVETGAFKNDRTAGEMLRHDAHKPGYDPHYQTQGKKGHTFYKSAAAFLAPNSMNMSGRGCATNMQMLSAGLWDVASAIDPIGLTDAIEMAVGLNNDEE